MYLQTIYQWNKNNIDNVTSLSQRIFLKPEELLPCCRIARLSNVKRTLTCCTTWWRVHAEKTEQLITVFTSTRIHLIFVSVTIFLMFRAFCSSRKTKTKISAEACTLSWRELIRLVSLKSTGPSFLISGFHQLSFCQVTLYGGVNYLAQ